MNQKKSRFTKTFVSLLEITNCYFCKNYDLSCDKCYDELVINEPSYCDGDQHYCELCFEEFGYDKE